VQERQSQYNSIIVRYLTLVVLQAMGLKSLASNIALTHSYYFAFLTTGIAAGLTYYLLAVVFPQQSYLIHRDEKFKEWTEDEVEVYAAGKRVVGVNTAYRGEDEVETPGVEKKSGEAAVGVLEA
jgi:NCS1 family nucleobase:cation symporter-1